MTTFDLPSLHMATRFDEPVPTLTVPGVLRSGRDARAMYILDGANRGPRRLARLTRSVALLGVKVDAHADLRITVDVALDVTSTRMWDRLRPRASEQRPVLSDSDFAEEEPDEYRAVMVGVQGRSRALLLLRRREGVGQVNGTVVFDVAREEIGDHGVVALSFEPADLPGHAPRLTLKDHSLVGLCIARVTVDTADDRPTACLSTGAGAAVLPATKPRSPRLDPDLGFFAVTCGPTSAVDVQLKRVVPPSPGRRVMLRHPVREWPAWRERRNPGDSRHAVVVRDADGEVVARDEIVVSGGTGRLTLPAGSRSTVEVDGLAGAEWSVSLRRSRAR